MHDSDTLRCVQSVRPYGCGSCFSRERARGVTEAAGVCGSDAVWRVLVQGAGESPCKLSGFLRRHAEYDGSGLHSLSPEKVRIITHAHPCVQQCSSVLAGSVAADMSLALLICVLPGVI